MTPTHTPTYTPTLAEKNIFVGYEDGSFKPDNKITRAEFITAIMRAYNIKPADNKAKFIDSNEIPGWAEGYIAVSIEKILLKVILMAHLNHSNI